MKKKILIFLATFVACTTGAFAQKNTETPITNSHSLDQEAVIKSCGTIAPPLEWENWLQQKIAEYKADASKQGLQHATYKIPMIFHILHNGEPVGVGRNLAAARVQEQIDRLNLDFSKTNPDFSTVPAIFKPLAADFSISFCLAKVDANGNTLTEPGINRINIDTKGLNPFPWTTAYMNTNVKPVTIWSPEKFLNVWVYTPAPLANNSTLLGYATFPPNSGLVGIPSGSVGTTTTDGFAVNFRFLGTNASVSSTGRTATHEIGHWLGLRHIWGDDSCGNDFCKDTPPQLTNNYGCKTHPYNIGACEGDTTGEMFMNYMDYSDDKCLNMFTNDQKTRAVAALSNSPMRKALITSNRCEEGDKLPPKVNFASNKQTVTVGSTVNFYDLSLNVPTSWRWTFEGGIPASDTLQNPVNIRYNAVGQYNVKLTAKNAIGKDSLVKTLYITVVGVTNTCDTLKNYRGNSFALYTVGDKALPYDSGYVGGTNYLKNKAIAEKYTASPGKSISAVNLYFGKARVRLDSSTQIKVNIWAADNNGAPSIVIASKSVLLSTISTKSITNVQFNPPVSVSSPFFVGFDIPDASQYDTIAVFTSRITDGLINLGWFQSADNKWNTYTSRYNVGLLNNIIFPVFCPVSGGGVVTEDLKQQVTVYPNPSSGSFNVDVKLSVSDDLTIEVLNLLGQVISRKQETNSNGGIFNLNLGEQAAGCYFVKVSSSNASVTKRIIISK